MAVDVKRLAAAQTHARMRQQDKAMQDVRRQQMYQNELGRLQFMQDRRRQRRMGAIQGVLGTAIGVGGAFTGNPAMIGAGAGMLAGGIASGTGSPELAPSLATAGQAIGSGIGQAMHQNQMGELSQQMKHRSMLSSANQAGAMNDAMGYGNYQQNLLSPEQYALRGATPVTGVQNFAASLPYGMG